jgi:anti-sigma factor RsiW
MTEARPVRETDVHALIDGELPPHEAGRVTAALAADPELAAQAAAFAADKAALAAAYAPVADEPVPAEWVARIRQAINVPVAPAPRRLRPAVLPRAHWIMALAACVVLAVGGLTLFRSGPGGGDQILAQAESARQSGAGALARVTGAALEDAPARDAMLAAATGLKLRTPDLGKLGWRLAELDTYPQAAALRYRAADGRALTLYVRRSNGAPRFDLLRNGALRTCIWQDEVVGAVMIGEMSAGQMMRVASAAYVALNL